MCRWPVYKQFIANDREEKKRKEEETHMTFIDLEK